MPSKMYTMRARALGANTELFNYHSVSVAKKARLLNF